MIYSNLYSITTDNFTKFIIWEKYVFQININK